MNLGVWGGGVPPAQEQFLKCILINIFDVFFNFSLYKKNKSKIGDQEVACGSRGRHRQHRLVRDVLQVDAAMAFYFDEMFGSGDSVHDGNRLMAAFGDAFPRFGPRGDLFLPSRSDSHR